MSPVNIQEQCGALFVSVGMMRGLVICYRLKMEARTTFNVMRCCRPSLGIRVKVNIGRRRGT